MHSIGISVTDKMVLRACTCDGYPFYVDRNEHVGHRVYHTGSFDTSLRDFLNENVTDPMIIYDVGANIGTVCIPLAQLQNVKVIAFEPADRNFSLLVINNYLNSKKVKTVPLATSDNKYNNFELRELSVNSVNAGSSSLLPEWNSHRGSVEVQNIITARLDFLQKFYGLQKPDIIKIDVEGFVAEVIRSSTSLISTEVLFVLEWRPDLARGAFVHELLELFENYTFFPLDKTGKIHSEFDKNNKYDNIILAHKETKRWKFLDKIIEK